LEYNWQYNEIARSVAQEVGDIIIEDLYGYVEDFCQYFPKDNASTPFAGNYTDCAIQTTGLHFFNNAPQPSGQQYTGISIAEVAIRNLPQAEINNRTAAEHLPSLMEPLSTELGSCGNAPAPLSNSTPNVLVIGDSISMPGTGYGPGLQRIFEQPGQPFRKQSGKLATVQHNGGTGSNQAGPSTNGVACIGSWLGPGYLWDVITINFGIHDCAPGGDGRPNGTIVPEAAYVQNLGDIYAKASKALAPGGKIVWVTTTPVSTSDPGVGFNTCVDTYNAAALKLLGAKSDVVVADLNAAVNKVCGKGYEDCNLQRWHNVHFTTAGKQFCAVEVANTVAPLLAPKWKTIFP
jgi:lysophospholipase L1-like esterase